MRVLIALLLMTSIAQAQTKDYNLSLSSAEVNQIATLLGAQPYREVAALIAKLRAQIEAQEKTEKK